MSNTTQLIKSDVGSNVPFQYAQPNSTSELILSPFPTAANLEIHRFYDDDVLVFKFDNPYHVAPAEPVVEPVERLVLTAGDYSARFDYFYFETTSDGRFQYKLVEKDSTATNSGRDINDVAYDPSNNKFHDVGSANPAKWGIDDTGTNTSAFPTAANMPILYFYDANGNLKFQFDNPYYVAPAEPTVTYTFNALDLENTLEISNTEFDIIDANNELIVYNTGDLTLHPDMSYYPPGESGNPQDVLNDDDYSTSHQAIYRKEGGITPPVNGLFTFTTTLTNIHSFKISYYKNYGVTSMDILKDGVLLGHTQTSEVNATYGGTTAKIYTLDGAEPVVEPVPRLVAIAGNWFTQSDYLYFETTPTGRYLYGLVAKGSTDRYNGIDQWDVEYDTNDGKFHDVGSKTPHTWGVDNTGTNLLPLPTANNMQTIYFYASSGDLEIGFDNPYYVAPDEPVVEPVERLVTTDGSWNGLYDYVYIETTSDGRFLYGLVDKGSNDFPEWSPPYDVEYEPSDGKFYDVGSSHPAQWGEDNTGTNLTAFPTAANLETQFWYDASDDLRFQFHNPYYVAPSYRYLAFYGVSGAENGYLFELESTTSSGFIKYNNNPIPVNDIYISEGKLLTEDYNNPDCLFDGCYTQDYSVSIIYRPDETGILLYLDATDNQEVISGTYYTTNLDSTRITQGKIYGTNSDPTTFDATNPDNWNFVCDLASVQNSY
jgi:hypothetical protein